MSSHTLTAEIACRLASPRLKISKMRQAEDISRRKTKDAREKQFGPQESEEHIVQ